MRLFVTILLLSAGFAGGWQLRDFKAQSAQAQMQADRAQQLALFQQQARQREQHLQQKMAVLQHETQQQLAEISALELERAADNRVRELATHYAAGGGAGSNSSAPRSCPTERKRAAVLAELLAELDALAGQFAATADRNRISGLACEKAYAAVQKDD